MTDAAPDETVVEKLPDRWRRRAERDRGPDEYAEGYNAALKVCADELAAVVDANGGVGGDDTPTLCPSCRSAGNKNWCRVEWCDSGYPKNGGDDE